MCRFGVTLSSSKEIATAGDESCCRDERSVHLACWFVKYSPVAHFGEFPTLRVVYFVWQD